MAPKKSTKEYVVPPAIRRSTSSVNKMMKPPPAETPTRALRSRAAKAVVEENLASDGKVKKLTLKEKQKVVEREDIEMQVDELIAEESKPKPLAKRVIQKGPKAEEAPENEITRSSNGLLHGAREPSITVRRSARLNPAPLISPASSRADYTPSSASFKSPSSYRSSNSPSPVAFKSPRSAPFKSSPGGRTSFRSSASSPGSCKSSPGGRTSLGSSAFSPTSPSPSQSPESPILHHLLHSSAPLQTPLTPRVDWGTVVDHDGNLRQCLPFEDLHWPRWDREAAERRFSELMETGKLVDWKKNDDRQGWWPELYTREGWAKEADEAYMLKLQEAWDVALQKASGDQKIAKQISGEIIESEKGAGVSKSKKGEKNKKLNSKKNKRKGKEVDSPKEKSGIQKSKPKSKLKTKTAQTTISSFSSSKHQPDSPTWKPTSNSVMTGNKRTYSPTWKPTSNSIVTLTLKRQGAPRTGSFQPPSALHCHKSPSHSHKPISRSHEMISTHSHPHSQPQKFSSLLDIQKLYNLYSLHNPNLPGPFLELPPSATQVEIMRKYFGIPVQTMQAFVEGLDLERHSKGLKHLRPSTRKERKKSFKGHLENAHETLNGVINMRKTSAFTKTKGKEKERLEGHSKSKAQESRIGKGRKGEIQKNKTKRKVKQDPSSLTKSSQTVMGETKHVTFSSPRHHRVQRSRARHGKRRTTALN